MSPKQPRKNARKKCQRPDTVCKIRDKSKRLANALKRAKHAVVYTGAGISTAASIPDYRGPQGVWTLSKKGLAVAGCEPLRAKPTLTHMALRELYSQGLVKHVLSQNCDGLHLRSGLPQVALSEVHGNMYIEVCKNCDCRQYVRDFDVTKRTSFRKHKTDRKCNSCAEDLHDTIVHMGEVGRFKWPLNWEGAMNAVENCDLIICIGSSLQILKKYADLWCNDRKGTAKPKLFVVNLGKTAKDSAADMKINAKCDDVFQQVMTNLNLSVPRYCRVCDPVLAPFRRNCKSNARLMHKIGECQCPSSQTPQPSPSLIDPSLNVPQNSDDSQQPSTSFAAPPTLPSLPMIKVRIGPKDQNHNQTTDHPVLPKPSNILPAERTTEKTYSPELLPPLTVETDNTSPVYRAKSNYNYHKSPNKAKCSDTSGQHSQVSTNVIRSGQNGLGKQENPLPKTAANNIISDDDVKRMFLAATSDLSLPNKALTHASLVNNIIDHSTAHCSLIHPPPESGQNIAKKLITSPEKTGSPPKQKRHVFATYRHPSAHPVTSNISPNNSTPDPISGTILAQQTTNTSSHRISPNKPSTLLTVSHTQNCTGVNMVCVTPSSTMCSTSGISSSGNSNLLSVQTSQATIDAALTKNLSHIPKSGSSATNEPVTNLVCSQTSPNCERPGLKLKIIRQSPNKSNSGTQLYSGSSELFTSHFHTDTPTHGSTNPFGCANFHSTTPSNCSMTLTGGHNIPSPTIAAPSLGVYSALGGRLTEPSTLDLGIDRRHITPCSHTGATSLPIQGIKSPATAHKASCSHQLLPDSRIDLCIDSVIANMSGKQPTARSDVHKNTFTNSYSSSLITSAANTVSKLPSNIMRSNSCKNESLWSNPIRPTTTTYLIPQQRSNNVYHQTTQNIKAISLATSTAHQITTTSVELNALAASVLGQSNGHINGLSAMHSQFHGQKLEQRNLSNGHHFGDLLPYAVTPAAPTKVEPAVPTAPPTATLYNKPVTKISSNTKLPTEIILPYPVKAASKSKPDAVPQHNDFWADDLKSQPLSCNYLVEDSCLKATVGSLTAPPTNTRPLHASPSRDRPITACSTVTLHSSLLRIQSTSNDSGVSSSNDSISSTDVVVVSSKDSDTSVSTIISDPCASDGEVATQNKGSPVKTQASERHIKYSPVAKRGRKKRRSKLDMLTNPYPAKETNTPDAPNGAACSNDPVNEDEESMYPGWWIHGMTAVYRKRQMRIRQNRVFPKRRKRSVGNLTTLKSAEVDE